MDRWELGGAAIAVAGWLFIILCKLVFYGVVVYIMIHFMMKWW